MLRDCDRGGGGSLICEIHMSAKCQGDLDPVETVKMCDTISAYPIKELRLATLNSELRFNSI